MNVIEELQKLIEYCLNQVDWEILRDWVSFSADIAMLLITLYTFYLTFLRTKLAFVG